MEKTLCIISKRKEGVMGLFSVGIVIVIGRNDSRIRNSDIDNVLD